MKQLLSKGVIKNAICLKELPTIIVWESIEKEYWLEKESYEVQLSWHADVYQFDWEKFYADVPNLKEAIKQLEEHNTILEKMKEEGKTKEEMDERMKGKGTEFIDRVEMVFANKEIYGKVKELINYL